ncbi:dihydrofolate reductase family protein [Micrococcales bacterium 31B]|nr:dihydrofolate reductase family protein [Micrococcales bacterium 31B]
MADSRGRVRWTFTGDENMALLVLVCEHTPLNYLQFLRDCGIAYLVAVEARVDLREGLARLATTLDVTTVVADSGGTLNASLLKEGLVDEVDVAILPGLVGGLGTPSIMDGPTLHPAAEPLKLDLISVDAGPGGVVCLRYRVVRDGGESPAPHPGDA